jgi:hypothetical protein
LGNTPSSSYQFSFDLCQPLRRPRHGHLNAAVGNFNPQQSRHAVSNHYRGWAWRFARWLEQRGSHGGSPSTRLEDATKHDVETFLSRLAVEYRASVSTQKQALNALVFLLRDVCGKQLGGLQWLRTLTSSRASSGCALLSRVPAVV